MWKVSLRLWVVAHIRICTRMVLFHMQEHTPTGCRHARAPGAVGTWHLWVGAWLCAGVPT